MVNISVKLDVRTMLASKKLAEKETRKAAARAINRGVDSGATVMGRAISKASRIPVREVRKRMWIRGASPDRLINEIGALPYAPNLRKYNATENTRGVAATAWERRKTYKHAFQLPSGKVVARVGKERTPTKPLYGPSLPAVFMRPMIIAMMEERFMEVFQKTFAYEITRRLGK